MAGTNADFDAASFREAILFVFEMGAAPNASKRAVFHFPRTSTSTDPVDADGVPFAAAATVVHSDPPTVSVLCGVEYLDNNGQPTNAMGVIQPTQVKVTLLDQQYAEVEGCDRVVIDGDTYHYRRTEPPTGLFDVGVFVLHFAVDSES